MFDFPLVALISGGYDPDARRVIDYMASVSVAPSKSYQNIIDQVMRVRKNMGEHQRDYVFYHWAAETEAQALLTNWANPGTFTLTKAGTVTHTANQGFAAAGTTADALTSTFNLSVAGVGTNSVSIELYSRTNVAASGTPIEFGGATSTAITGRIRTTGGVGNIMQSRLNSTASVNSSSSITSSAGLFSYLRNSTGVLQFAQNGVQVGADVAVTDQAASNQNFNWLNAIVGTSTSSTKQIAFARVAQGMTIARTLEHYEQCTLPLLQWNGANV